MNAALRPLLPSVTRSRSDRADVLVISSDDALLMELGPILGNRYRVHTIDSPDQIGAQIDAVRWIGIVDADALGGAHAAISQLEAQYPACPLIVITLRPGGWVGSVARGAVLRAVARNQVATGSLGEALQVAEDRFSLPAPDHRHVVKPIAVPDRPEPRLRRPSSYWAGAATLLLVLGVNGAWLAYRYAPISRAGGRPAIDASSAQPSAGRQSGASASVPAGAKTDATNASVSALRAQGILELLSAARIAFRDQRLLPQGLDGAWKGDSALELYVQVLRQDPQDDEAQEGVKRLLVVGRNRVITDVASGQLDDANRLLQIFQAAGVAIADLQPLQRSISAAQPKWLAQRAAQDISVGNFTTADELIAQATTSGADAATVKDLRAQEAAKKIDLQLRAMATQVRAAVQAGALLQPVADSARTRLAAMRSIARSDARTLQAEQEVQEALVQAAEQASRAGRFDVADRDLSAASDLGGSTLLTLARAHLQAARDVARRTPTVAAVVVSQASATTVRALPLAPTATAPRLSSLRAFIAARPIRALPVSYPAGAEGDGSVVVEFTLSANGRASNVGVVQSDRPGVFDDEAIGAVRRGRYSTTDLVNKQPVRARIKLRFTPG